MGLYSYKVLLVDSIVLYALSHDVLYINNRPLFLSGYVIIKKYLMDTFILVIEKHQLARMTVKTILIPEIIIIFDSYSVIPTLNYVSVNIIYR